MSLKTLVPKPVKQHLKPHYFRLRHMLRWYDSPEKLSADSVNYWRQHDGAPAIIRGAYHELGEGPFSEEENWHAIGRQHFQIFNRFSKQCDFPRPTLQMIEWGCGGGANAAYFAPEAERFVGVDLAPAALQQCQRQMELRALTNFEAVLVEVSDVDAVVNRFRGEFDLFLCTYVFEILPTRAHALELLTAAHALLKPGGMALIQIKYETTDPSTKSRPFSYVSNFARNTAFRIDEFWLEAEARSFEPLGVFLIPYVPMIIDGYYAYFCLIKK
jgi:2-polyprenyl-3-methyl-5-hydroxy-6-metoxy-1,4-benzoquinol methylase